MHILTRSNADAPQLLMEAQTRCDYLHFTQISEHKRITFSHVIEGRCDEEKQLINMGSGRLKDSASRPQTLPLSFVVSP